MFQRKSKVLPFIHYRLLVHKQIYLVSNRLTCRNNKSVTATPNFKTKQDDNKKTRVMRKSYNPIKNEKTALHYPHFVNYFHILRNQYMLF